MVCVYGRGTSPFGEYVCVGEWIELWKGYHFDKTRIGQKQEVNFRF